MVQIITLILDRPGGLVPIVCSMLFTAMEPPMSECCDECFVKRVRDWYRGKYVPYENDPNSALLVLGGSYRRHWTSKLVHAAVDFYLAEWKWIIGTSIALWVVYLKL